MNFEFLKGLRGLSKMYTSCKDAEDLALSKPYLSMAASRKSAEALTKFVYINAYKDRAENLTFAEMLSDYQVKRYINSRYVLDAFHNIRKTGNSAVHGDEELTATQSIELLEDLHFIMGEVAKRAKLLSTYPEFNRSIEEIPDAEPHEIDINELVNAALEEYLAAEKIKEIEADFSMLLQPFYFLPWTIRLHENIEFRAKPRDAHIISHLQEYFGSIIVDVLKKQRFENDTGSRIDIKITTTGEDSISTSDIFECMDVLLHKLPTAEKFTVDFCYYGREFRRDKQEDWTLIGNLATYFSEGKKEERFCYKQFCYMLNYGEMCTAKVVDGETVNVQNFESNGIIHKSYSHRWDCTNLDLYVDFEFEKHPRIVNELRNAVKKHIPTEEYQYCHDFWEKGYAYVLVNSISWQPKSLKDVQTFLNEVNSIIAPIKDQCDCSAQGTWYFERDAFAVARWDWTEKGFMVIGSEF